MSEQFYERFISLFFGFIVLLTLIVVPIELFFFYFSTQNDIFYYAYLLSLVICSIYFVKYFLKFRDFRDNLSLLFPFNASETGNLPCLDIEVEDVALKTCLFYRNGSSFEEIKKDLGFSHTQQVKRELIKGLGFLLKFYDDHREVSS